MWDRDRVIRYAERYFQRSGRTEWPDVRKVAKALRMRQSQVSEIVEQDDDMCLSYYNVEWEVPLGDYYVDVINPPE